MHLKLGVGTLQVLDEIFNHALGSDGQAIAWLWMKSKLGCIYLSPQCVDVLQTLKISHSLSLSLYLSVSMFLIHSLSIHLSISLSLCLFLFVYVSLNVSLNSLSLSLCYFQFLSMSLFSLYLSQRFFSVLLTIFLINSLSLAVILTHKYTNT